MALTIHPYDTTWVRRLRGGGPDDYGNPAERTVSDGGGNPCRHCLQMIPEGAGMLVAAARPFPEKQPYAETGPIFLCADECAPYQGRTMPPCVAGGEDRLVKGYTADHRIRYGTGAIVAPGDLAMACEAVLRDDRVAFVDIRSSRNNCFTFRVTRPEAAAP